MSFQAAGHNRLLGRQSYLIEEPMHVWQTEFRQLAARAVEIAENDPFAQAMIRAKLFGTHGAEGLQFRSLYSLDSSPETSDAERIKRRAIEEQIQLASRRTLLDVNGLLTRKQLEEAHDWVATVKGDSFLVRRIVEDGQQSTRWRLVQPERVTNPDGRANDDRLYEGIELDENGRRVAIHVETGRTGPFGIMRDKRWVRIPWEAPDGTPNVSHKVGLRIPGMLRGVSMFAPMILVMRQVSGTVEAHVSGKRAQACHPIIEKTEDKDRLAEAEREGATLGPYTNFKPLQVLLTDLESEVIFPQHKFEGSDLKDFLQTLWRLLCADWGFPVEVVLQQMGEASLSSARAGLDAFNRRCHELQDEHATDTTNLIDESIIRESVIRGRLSFDTDDWRRIMAGKYKRPAKFVTDSMKEAQAVAQEIEAGRSRRNAFAERGWDWEAETQERRREDDMLAAQGQAETAEAIE